MTRLIFVLLGFAVAEVQVAYAKDFGKYGVTMEVREEGFLAMVLRKLKTIDMAKVEEKMQKQVEARVHEPVAVAGITRTTKARSYTFDPTYTLQEDIYLPDGNLLHAEGTKVNPLNHMDLNRKMLFIDARDVTQEEWLKDQIKNHNKDLRSKEEELIVILVSGRPLELQDRLGKEIYFDQNGVLSSRFGIKQVPALVTQEEKLLRIEEIEIK
jgi:conjugal transfer pilus assembly protein TraW